VKTLLIDNGTTLLKKLETLVSVQEKIERFDVFKIEDARDFDVTVLSGSSIGPLFGNEEKFSEEIKFIKETTKPVVGICFGCELIVRAFGGELEKMEQKDRGMKEIQITDLILYKRPQVKVYENHQWRITRLSEDFDVLAKSESGPEIIKHKTKSIYGFQFHPENCIDVSAGYELFGEIFSKISGSI